MLAACLWDAVFTIYGRYLPSHPGKWRVVELLKQKAYPAWKEPRFASCRGIRFQLDLSDYIERSIYCRDFDAPETHLLIKIVKPGWIVMDVGANIGYYSLLLSRLVGSKGTVYAFEPAAETWKRLLRTIELNRPTNIFPSKVALADRCGKVSFVTASATNTGKGRLARSVAEGLETVDQITLDAFSEQHQLKRIDFIKVDIEGCEERLLDGGRKTMARFKPSLIMEINPQALETLGATADSLISKLRKMGYELFEISWFGLRRFRRFRHGTEYINVWVTQHAY